MARIPALTPEQVSEKVKPVYNEIETGLGRIANMYRTAAHAETVVGDLFRLGRHFLVKDDAALDYALLRMVHLRVSHMNDCAYCATHNANWSTRAGASERKLLAAISPDPQNSPELNDREKVALAWADAITINTAREDDELYERLTSYFGPREVVTLTLAVAYRNMINRFVDALQVDIEEAAVAACPIDITR